MSDVNIQKELDGYKMQLKNVSAQLEAVKQEFNQSMSSCVQLRTAIVLLQQDGQEKAQKIASLTKELDESTKVNAAITAELNILKNPPAPVAPVVQQPASPLTPPVAA